jgi:hypothetical protein
MFVKTLVSITVVHVPSVVSVPQVGNPWNTYSIWNRKLQRAFKQVKIQVSYDRYFQQQIMITIWLPPYKYNIHLNCYNFTKKNNDNDNDNDDDKNLKKRSGKW